MVERQQRFALLLGQLLVWAFESGYRVTVGEAWRPEATSRWYASLGTGIPDSLHTVRLAVDLNLFVDGVYQETSEVYRPLGDHWKSLDPDARWGGDFKKCDGNHFSLAYNGRA